MATNQLRGYHARNSLFKLMDHLERFSRQFGAKAWNVAHALTRNSADADDVLQQAYIIAAQKLNPEQDVHWHWFTEVILNCSRNFRRREARRQSSDEIEKIAGDAGLDGIADDRTPSPDQQAHAREMRERLLTELYRLPELEREALALCCVAGLTVREASKAANVGLSTLKSRLSRGTKRMRERLGGDSFAVERGLAAVAFPGPVGGLSSAIKRWESGAISASSATTGAAIGASYAISKAMWLGLAGLAVMVSLAILAFELLGPEPEPPDPARTPVAASAPGDLQPDPAVLAGIPSQPGDEGSGPTGDAENPVAPATAPARARPSVPDRPLEYTGPLTPAGPNPVGTLQLRTIEYSPGKPNLQFYELVTVDGAVMNGLYYRFNPDGSLLEDGEYKDGVRYGTWRQWHAPGKVRSEGSHRGDRRFGMWHFYDRDGNPSHNGPYDENEQRTGTWQYFYPNGKPKQYVPLKDGRKNGIVIDFDEQGRKTLETPWKDGKREGRETVYLEPDQPTPGRLWQNDLEVFE